MAIRIPIYTQQTATPQGGVQGGGLTSDVGRGMGGALLDAAQAVGGFARERKAKMDEIETSEATAYASTAVAGYQRDVLRFMEEQKAKSGAGGKGYTEAVNAWATARRDEIIAGAPNEKARTFLTTQMTDALTRADAAALGYEVEERQRNNVVTFESGIKLAADSAARDPAQATLYAAQQRAAIMADPTLSEDVRATLVANVTSEVSFAAVLGDVERNVYGAQQQLRRRLGFGTPEQGQAVNQGEVAGIMAEANRRAQAGEPDADIEAWMADAMAKAGVKVDTSRAGEDVTDEPSGDGRTWAYASLTTQQVVSLLSRADAEIARRENEAKQAAEFGKLEWKQAYNDKMAAVSEGESVTGLPSEAELQMYLGPEAGRIQFRDQQIKVAMAGELQAMNGQTSEELAAVVMTPPTGDENRIFRNEAYIVKRDRAIEILKQREADPGGYVQATSPIVRDSYAAYTELASQPNADQTAVLDAQRRYIAASTSEQTRLGIATPKLPAQFLAGMQQDMATALKSNDAVAIEAATIRVQHAASVMSRDYPELAGQIAGISDIHAFSVDGVPGVVIKRVTDASAVPEAKLKDALPTNVQWAQVESAVNDAFQPLLRTIGDQPTRSRYLTSATRLAAEMVISGVESDPKAAARKAYGQLFGDYNTAVDSYRIPLAAGPDRVVSGLADIVREFPLDRVNAPVADWMTPEMADESRRRYWRTVQTQARWINNQVGDGVILTVNGGVVTDVDGNPIQVSFNDAVNYVPKSPSPAGGMGGPASVGRIGR